MALLDYIKTFLPILKKDRLVEDARITSEELKNVSVTSFKNVIQQKIKFDNELHEQLSIVFNRIYGKNQDMVKAIHSALENSSKCADVIYDRVSSDFEDDIVIQGVSLVKANIIKCLELLTFISKYSVSMLNALMVYERAKYEDNPKEYISDNLSPKEINDIQASFHEFAYALLVFDKSENDFKKVIDQIPDMVITNSFTAASASVIKVDPLGLSKFGNVTNNVIYHIQMMVAERQAKRYDEMKELKKILELRMLDLKSQEQKNPNAVIQRDIELTQSRIQKLKFEMEKLENS